MLNMEGEASEWQNVSITAVTAVSLNMVEEMRGDAVLHAGLSVGAQLVA